jgi:hypothetical protein
VAVKSSNRIYIIIRRLVSVLSVLWLYFCDYLPFEGDLVLYLNNLESPSPKDNLYQVWLNLVCWFWRRFLKNFSVFLLFRDYLPLEKGYPFRLNNFECPLPKDDLRQVWLKLVQRFWRRSRKCKSLQTDRQTDAGHWVIRKAHLSFQLRWAKNVKIYSRTDDGQWTIKKAYLSSDELQIKSVTKVLSRTIKAHTKMKCIHL